MLVEDHVQRVAVAGTKPCEQLPVRDLAQQGRSHSSAGVIDEKMPSGMIWLHRPHRPLYRRAQTTDRPYDGVSAR